MVFDPELLAKIEQRKRSNPAPAGRRFYTETQRKLACGLDVSDRSADSTDCSINNTTQETLYTPIRSADRRELILRRQELTRRTFTAMGGDYNQFETAPPKFEPNITIENTDESDDEETSMASTLQDEDTPPTKKSRQYREPSSPLEHKAESDQEMEETREHDEIVVSSYEEDQSMPVVRSGIRPSRASSEPMFDDDDARSTSYSLSRNEEEQSLDAPTPETGPRPQNQHQDEDTPPTKKSRQYREPSSPLEHNAGSDQEMEELPEHDEFVVSSYEEESYIEVVHSGIRPSRASSELIFGDDNARSTSYSLSRNEKDLSLDDPAPETCPRPRNQHRFGRRNFDNSTIADSMTPFVVPQRNQRKSNKKTDATSTSLIEEDDGEHIEMVLKKPSLVVPDSPDGPLRRSQRTRVAPMRRWLGEEPVYESSPGGSRTMTDVSRVVMRDPLFVKTKSSDIVKANNRARRDK